MNQLNRQHIAFGFYLLLVGSLLFSKYLISIAMIGLIVTGLIRNDFKEVWHRFIQNKALLSLTGVFFLILITGLYSENSVYWAERVRIKLPFLLLPLTFAGLPAPDRKQFFGVFYLLIVLLTACCCWIGAHYLLNLETIHLDIKESRSMPTPINHIRFSLLIALSLIAGAFIFASKAVIRYRWERWVLAVCLIFLFVFLHILSVRSGIAAFYLVAGFLLLRYIFISKKYVIGALMLAGLIALPVLAYQFVHTFRTKVQLVVWNYKMYKEGNLKHYSDTQRFFSYGIGWEIAQSSPLIGIGAGDVKDEVFDIYKTRYSEMIPMLPHNQYLFVLVAAGWIGLTLFLLLMIFPLFYRKNYKNGFLLGFYGIVLLSFLVENTIENSIGTAFVVFFLLLTLNYIDRENKNPNQELSK